MKKIALCLALLSPFFCNASPIPAPTLKTQLPKLNAIDVDFVDAPVRSVLMALSEHTRKPVVLSDEVQGTVSVSLKQVSPLHAFDTVLRSKGFFSTEKDGVLLVSSISKTSSFPMEALETKTIRLKYSKVSDLKQFFSDNKLLSERGGVFYDARSNSVTISDFPDSVARVSSIISDLDVPLDQVYIEAKLVEVSTDFSKDLGFKISSSASSGDFSFSGDFISALTSMSSFGFGVLSKNFNLSFALDAIEKEGLSKTISSPKILTQDNSEAVVSSGQEIPYQTSTVTSVGTTTNTSFKDALLSLKVTPSISPDGRVQMKINISNDSLRSYAQNGEAILNKNQVLTTVSIDDSSTVVLGGIYIDTAYDGSSKVPVLSSIPYLGKAFKSSSSKKEKKQLLVFLTPKVVKTPPK